jgi:signal transduction histidine kinase
MGLAGMRERILSLGGTVVVGTAPAGGVRLVARIPTAERETGGSDARKR